MAANGNKPNFIRRLLIGLQRLVITLLLLGVIIGGVGGYVWWLWTSEPEGWQEEQVRRIKETVEVRERRAENIQRKFLQAMNRPTATEEQRFRAPRLRTSQNTSADGKSSTPASSTVKPQVSKPKVFDPQFLDQFKMDPRVSEEKELIHFQMTMVEFNDWLTFNLASWLKQQGHNMPKEITNIAVAQEDGKPLVMFEYTTTKFTQIFSTVFNLRWDDNGKIHMSISQVRGGQLPIPAGTASQVAQATMPADLRHEFEQKLRLFVEGKAFSPIYKVDRNRVRRMVGYHMDGSKIDLIFEVVEPPQKRKPPKNKQSSSAEARR